jgi:hypothetical protein
MAFDTIDIAKRRKLYNWFLVIQLINILTGIVLVSIGEQEQFGLNSFIVIPFQLAVLLSLQIVILKLISSFLRKWQKIIFGVILFVPNLIIGIPDAPQFIYLIGMILLITVNIFTIMILTKDIFLHQHDASYSLIGAANIYLGTPIIFTCVYVAMELYEPGLMGQSYDNFSALFLGCIEYSWYVLTGLENNVSPNIGRSILNVSIFESILGNLFIIFVVGRLLITKKS